MAFVNHQSTDFDQECIRDLYKFLESRNKGQLNFRNTLVRVQRAARYVHQKLGALNATRALWINRCSPPEINSIFVDDYSDLHEEESLFTCYYKLRSRTSKPLSRWIIVTDILMFNSWAPDMSDHSMYVLACPGTQPNLCIVQGCSREGRSLCARTSPLDSMKIPVIGVFVRLPRPRFLIEEGSHGSTLLHTLQRFNAFCNLTLER